MTKLNLYQIESFDELARPEAIQDITLDSPALSVLTDFTHYAPLVTDVDEKAADIEQKMLRNHVRLKLVVDKANQFLGLISLEDLNAQEILKKVAQGYTRDDLSAFDFMRSKNALKALDYKELKQATVGDLVQILKDNPHQHYLVIDRGLHKIRGVISASDLARKLRLDINVNQRSSFVDVYLSLYPNLTH